MEREIQELALVVLTRFGKFMRIISGRFKGRKLADSSELKELRPITDRNREAIFNILNSAKFIKTIGFNITNCNVLDLCCGTGSFGFEALSRGAKWVLFVDNNYRHLEKTKQNAKILSLEKDEAEFLLCDAKNFSLDKKFDLIYIDPPYSVKIEDFIDNIFAKQIFHKQTLIIVESAKHEINNDKFQILEKKIYGKTVFNFLFPK